MSAAPPVCVVRRSEDGRSLIVEVPGFAPEHHDRAQELAARVILGDLPGLRLDHRAADVAARRVLSCLARLYYAGKIEKDHRGFFFT